jgi:hypothetical protein
MAGLNHVLRNHAYPKEAFICGSLKFATSIALAADRPHYR